MHLFEALSQPIHLDLLDADSKAIIWCNTDYEITVLEFMGNALRYYIAEYTVEDLPIKPEQPGLWYIEGYVFTQNVWLHDGQEWDEEWRTSVCRRLTSEELDTYQTGFGTPYKQEAKAESLMLFIASMCTYYQVTIDNDTIHVVLWQDGISPQNWNEFDRFSFTIQDYTENRKKVESLATKLSKTAAKWRSMELSAKNSIDLLQHECDY